MYIDFVSISGVTSSCSISLNVSIVICIVSSVSVCPVNKIVKKKKKIQNECRVKKKKKKFQCTMEVMNEIFFYVILKLHNVPAHRFENFKG